MRKLRIALGMSVVLLSALPGCAASSSSEPAVAVELEAEENTVDGCMSCGCRAIGVLESSADGEWWVSFGLVAADAQDVWAVRGASTRCGSGSFEMVSSDFRETLGTPYLVLDLSMAAAPREEGESLEQGVSLDIEMSVQKLSGFDSKGRAEYSRSQQKRTLSFTGQGEITLPVLVADEREEESFGIHEVALRLLATVVGREPAASYGAISVSADLPGSEVLLDGGFAGRIAEDRSILLNNVLVGKREIRVRDLSNREASRQVVVKEGETTEVALAVLDLESAGPGRDLIALGQNPQGYKEYWRAKDGAVVVRIPSGEFVMGSREGQNDPSERPQRPVQMSQFLIDKTEVTWRQFRKYSEATGTALPPAPLWGTPDDYPVSYVLWEEAKSYCEWVGGRLLTEAEWEKAARGSDGRLYPWGDTWDAQRCNSLHGGYHRPDSVGSYSRCLSPYGVLDMAGSVWEWCADWYDGSYYAASSEQDPKGPSSGSAKVLRGASWLSPYLWLRTAFRYKADPAWRNPSFGFRCGQEAPE